MRLRCRRGVAGRQAGAEGLVETSDYCNIAVEDNGIGFEQEYSARIFEVFQRLHSNRDYAGTGIGLAIVKKIIENHGGRIFAKGEPGRGARFDIYLPSSGIQ